MKWNKCFVVQYGNIQYTNIVVKMEISVIFVYYKKSEPMLMRRATASV